MLRILKYFSLFDYSPSLDEIFTLFPVKIKKSKIAKTLKGLVEKGKIIELSFQDRQRYLLFRENFDEKGFISSFLRRERITRSKLEKIKVYLFLLSKVPFIRFVTLTGSLATLARGKNDDIDLFIVSAGCRMWTARFFSIFLAFILGLKRKRGIKQAPNKVCLNLFFDECDLRIPKVKQTAYVAQEILRMRPLFDKDKIYQRILLANKWILEFFPNAVFMFEKKKTNNESFPCSRSLLERVMRSVQLFFINRHRTTELISDTQLWFYPEDFERIAAPYFS